MILILICTILTTIIFCLYAIHLFGFRLSEIFLMSLMGLFLGILIGSLLFVTSFFWLDHLPDAEKEIIYDEKIELFEDKVLNTTLDEDFVYIYKYKDPNYGIVTNTVNAKYVYIKYIEDYEQAYVQKFYKVHKNKIIQWLLGPNKYNYCYHTIYIHKNSLVFKD